MSRYLIMISGFLIAFSSYVCGQVVVTLSPSTTTISPAGGTISFTASIEGTVGDGINAYDLFVDVVGVDLDSPGPISITNQNFIASFDVTDATQPADSRDIGFSAANVFTPDVSIDGGPVSLFSFDATFSPNAAGQTFPFELGQGMIGTGLSINGNLIDLNTVTFNNSVVTVAAAVVLGDVNMDGSVNFLDIAPFVSVLGSGELQAEADIDQNGLVNFLDIAPFIALLSQ